MIRVLAIAGLMLVSQVQAQPPKPAANTIPLTVSPAAAPGPALRYELLPKLRDRSPGNGALDYHRAYLLKPVWPRDPEEARKQDELLAKWEAAPTEKLPAAEVRKFLLPYASSMRMLYQAARCDRCDWELTRKIQFDSIGTLLPEVQAFRELARFQRLRIRADLAENDFEAAVRDLQTGYRMARDIGSGPSLIHLLVGHALTMIFTGEVERFMERPGAPNLYWAFTMLPRPFIDPRLPLEAETLYFESLFPNVREFEKGPLSADRANLLLNDLLTTFRAGPGAENIGNDPFAVIGKLGIAAYIALHSAEAKAELLAAGWKAEVLDKMPATQLVVLRAINVYRTLYDDQAKCFQLPYPQARIEFGHARDRMAKLTRNIDTDMLIQLFSLTLPAMGKVYEAHARTERRFAGLRTIEAIRLHAAANGGQLPKTLAEITLVVVPDDPNTGKPFEYAATPTGFVLTASPPTGEEPSSGNNFRYEVTLRN